MAECSDSCKVRGFLIKDLGRKYGLVNAAKDGPPERVLDFDFDSTEAKGVLAYVLPSGTPYYLKTPGWLTAEGRGCIANRCPAGTMCRWGQIDFAPATTNEEQLSPRVGIVEVVCADSGEVAAQFEVTQFGNPAMKPEIEEDSCEKQLKQSKQENADLQEQLDMAEEIISEKV